MDDAENAVTVLHGRRDDAQGDEVVDLIEVGLLALEFLVDRPETFDAAVDGHHGNLRIREFAGQCGPQLFHQNLGCLPAGFDLAAQLLVGLGLQVPERQFLELVFDLAHAEPVGDRRVDVAGLLGDPHPAVLRQVVEGPHVVQAVGQFDHDDADVIDHGQEHLAETFGLPLLAGGKLQAGQFGHPLNNVGDLLAEQFPDFFNGIGGVLHDVVEQACGHGHHVQALVGQQIRHLQGVDQIGLPRTTDLSLVLVGRKYVGPPEQLGVGVRVERPDFVDEIFEPNHFRGV